ncbi:RdgB/HAM1 family non-canonical purine NTP pyrophosphatase [Oleiharenicola lentus]|uniref:dITP/XTP pyrophosphatase n=1 Tax=Oleiharenicola lentus TaxID=2508720 RepID=A0A4Q1CCQ1_9BACT|nr:RdgB/HAM1 family non-canonical purine NTP pyrophosphatase [Oleiharenicola lentus]RXK56721.1 RdgB/HAM1 family non-canonical purine NTP pyrophosphatase [Oleiharenicola lentus]
MAPEPEKTRAEPPRLQVIHLASGNRHKAEEFQRLADESRLPLRIVPANPMPEVVEDAGTFVGNARKKAQALLAQLPAGSWVLADDSGVCVDALDGAPGVESAYFAGPQHDAAANLRKLTEVMRDVPESRRAARFVCVLVLLGGGAEEVFEGRCEGVLAREPQGGRGFGYDPLFIPAGHACTYAQLSDAEKNKISHRGRAWLILVEWWRSRISGAAPRSRP